jgi:hypothetical protein
VDVKKLLGVLVEIAVIFLVGFICGAVFIAKYSPSWLPDWLSPDGIAYSNLKIGSSDLGTFDGRIKLVNHENLHIDVLVTINVYDGDQEVGDLSGSVTLKPDSASNVELSSFDEFATYDNTTIELLPLPVGDLAE